MIDEKKKLKKVLVLINDNDVILAKVCRNKFSEQAGWEVFISSSYDESMKKIKKIKPDLLITELIINDQKGRTGFDLIKGVCNSKDCDDIKVIVFSDLAQSSDKEKAMKIGATRYFVKSEVSIKDVIDEVGELVTK